MLHNTKLCNTQKPCSVSFFYRCRWDIHCLWPWTYHMFTLCVCMLCCAYMGTSKQLNPFSSFFHILGFGAFLAREIVSVEIPLHFWMPEIHKHTRHILAPDRKQNKIPWRQPYAVHHRLGIWNGQTMPEKPGGGGVARPHRAQPDDLTMHTLFIL